jgi:hypothetical protein
MSQLAALLTLSMQSISISFTSIIARSVVVLWTVFWWIPVVILLSSARVAALA